MALNRLPKDHEVSMLCKAIYGFANRLQSTSELVESDERKRTVVDFALSITCGVLVASESNPLIVEEFGDLLMGFMQRTGISVDPNDQ